MDKVVFIFKRKNIFSFKKNGPREFFYGAHDLRKNENNKILFAGSYNKKNLFWRLFEILISKKTKLGIYFQAYLNNKEKIQSRDVLMGMMDGIGLGLLFFKWLKKIDNKIIFVAQGLHDRHQYFEKNELLIWFYKQLLNKAELILTFSKYEKKSLISLFDLPKNKVKVFYFGADLDYWNPRIMKGEKEKGYVLSVGNDMHRDYQLLMNVYDLDIPLKLVTKIIKKSKYKIYRNVSNEKLRRLYAESKFVVVPLKKSEATSGMSVVLQAMAMGKPVLLAGIPAMKELFRDQEEVLYYEAGNGNDLVNKLKELNKNEQMRQRLISNSKKLVKKKFNVQKMGRRLEKIINLIE
jgi:glycosyltransferase involved in cell wall biosynthesis